MYNVHGNGHLRHIRTKVVPFVYQLDIEVFLKTVFKTFKESKWAPWDPGRR